MHRCLPFLLLFLLLVPLSTALSFLLYNPLFARNHVNFLARLADVLSEAGHDVTIIQPVVDATIPKTGGENQKTIIIPQDPRNDGFESASMAHGVWRGSNWEMMTHMTNLLNALATQCNATLDDESMWNELRSRKFDAAFSEGFDSCGIAIFEVLDIKSFALTLSSSFFEGSFPLTGLPSFPSYVPGAIVSYGEKMTFLQRVVNFIPTLISPWVTPMFTGPFEAVFTEKYGERFKGVMEMGADASLFFLNNEPLIDFPKPTIHKIIDIGGITVSTAPEALNQSWSSLLDLRPHTVLLSFGTVVSSSEMPEEYKKNIRETFRRFPEVTFIWKYEKAPDKIAEGVDNIVEAAFVPQWAMLNDPRLSLFITHGGQGSCMEVTRAGVPLIAIPVMGDQQRNAQALKRAGTAILLEKEQLANADDLYNAIKTILHDDKSFLHGASALKAMLRDKPFSASEIFLRNMEFLAKFGPLRQFDHYGKELNFFQYYLVDVFAFLAAILVFVIVIIVWIVKCACRLCMRSSKRKTE